MQTNQTGELTAVLLAVKRHDPEENLRIVSDLKYVIDGLTKNLRKWEQRGWVDVSHGNLFKTIVAWVRWRTGDTYLQWTKGHNGTRGNEEVDRLASAGTLKPITLTNEDVAHPPGREKTGARGKP